jgi:hypothetical protein
VCLLNPRFDDHVVLGKHKMIEEELLAVPSTENIVVGPEFFLEESSEGSQARALERWWLGFRFPGAVLPFPFCDRNSLTLALAD